MFSLPKYNKSILSIARWMWRTSHGNRLQMTLNAVIGMLEVATSLGSVWAIKHAIDIASGAKEGALVTAVGIMAGIIGFDFALSISAVWVRNILGVKAQNAMQRRMLERVLRSEWQSKGAFHSGDVLNRLEMDVVKVVDFLAETLPSALSTACMFIGAFVYLYAMDNVLALITVAIVPVCVVLSKFYVSKMRNLNRRVRETDSEIQAVMQESVQNVMLIKTLESDDAVIRRLGDTQQELRQRVVKRTKFSVLSNLTMNLGFAGSYLLVFAWSAFRLADNTLSFGGMTAFLQLVNRIQSPARSLARLLPQSVTVLTAAERLMELEDVPEERVEEPLVVDAPCGLRLDDVTFAYEDGEPVIQNLSHDFRPGLSTAIVGETGAGKTTILRLLLALCHPTSGTLTIYNARENQSLNYRHRHNFVYVPQGNTLMSGSIRDNLLLGSPTATDEQMKEALHQSCADFVMQLPDGLDTLCSESGGGLSEGQAQRIAIARALLRDRPVMLFDEATSALDPETERQLLDNLLRTKQKTVIFITHRMAVCEYCDETLRL